jgi:hypothetical protein
MRRPLLLALAAPVALAGALGTAPPPERLPRPPLELPEPEKLDWPPVVVEQPERLGVLPAEVEPGRDAVERALTGNRYRQVPVGRSGAGYLWVAGELGGRPLRLLLDTGAPNTCLDRARVAAPRQGWQERPMGGRSYFFCRTEGLRVGELWAGNVWVPHHDLSELNRAVSWYGEPPFDGILGADVLRAHDAVIVYSTPALYLRLAE